MENPKNLVRASLRKTLLDESQKEKEEFKSKGTMFGASVKANRSVLKSLMSMVKKRTLESEQGTLSLEKIAGYFRDECLGEAYGKDNRQEVDDWVSTVTFTKDNELVVFAHGNGIHGVPVDTFKNAMPIELYEGDAPVLEIEFTVNNKFLVARTGHDRLLVFDVSRTESGELKLDLKREIEAPETTCFASTNEHLYVGCKHVRVFSFEEEKYEELLDKQNERVTALRCSSDAKYLVIGREDGTVQLINRETGKPVGEVDMGEEPVQQLAISSENRHVLGLDKDGKILVWDVAEMTKMGDYTEPSASFPNHSGENVTKMALSTENRVLVTSSEQGTIKVWDFEEASELVSFKCDEAIGALSLSPDRSTLASGYGKNL